MGHILVKQKNKLCYQGEREFTIRTAIRLNALCLAIPLYHTNESQQGRYHYCYIARGLHNLVPRGRDPSGLRQESRPLGKTESPPKRRQNFIDC